MGIEQTILDLFDLVLREHGGNKAAAAASLGVNTVTFWGWLNGKRRFNKTLCDAIDKAGGRLCLPGEDITRSAAYISGNLGTLGELEEKQYRQRITELEKEVRDLEKYRYKYEGIMEMMSRRNLESPLK